VQEDVNTQFPCFLTQAGAVLWGEVGKGEGRRKQGQCRKVSTPSSCVFSCRRELLCGAGAGRVTGGRSCALAPL
jgi:hypothetical protein